MSNPYQYLGSFSTPGGERAAEKPSVSIIAPDVSESPAQLDWSLGFIWTHPVDNFVIGDVRLSGDDTGVVLSSFAGSGRDYSCNITLPANAQGTVNISIPANVADGNGTTGPSASIGESIAYDTRPKSVPGTILCQLRKDNSNAAFLGEIGDVFRNVFSRAKLGDYLYVVVQIQRYGPIYARTQTGAPVRVNYAATTKVAAGAILYRIDTNDCSFQVIKRYANILTAARSLKAYNGRVYGIEGSHYAHLNDGLAVDPETGVAAFKRSRFQGVALEWKQECGNLFSIANDESEITQHGIWASAKPNENPNYDADAVDAFYGLHTGTASPLAVSPEGVHGVLGYGDYTKVSDTQQEAEATRYDNLAWLKYSTRLNQRLPVLKTDDRTAYEIVREIARLTGSILAYDGETFVFKPREALSAALRFSISATATTEAVIENRNYDFPSYPSAGQVLIGKELIAYTAHRQDPTGGLSRFSGLTRGVEETTAAAHDANDSVIWIDHALQLNHWTLEQPIDAIRVYDDTANFYNKIEISYADGQIYTQQIDASVAIHGVRPFEITLPLGTKDLEWVKWIAERFLARFGEIRKVVLLQLKPSPYLKLGDILFLDVPERLHLQGAYQVIEIGHRIAERRSEVRLVSL